MAMAITNVVANAQLLSAIFSVPSSRYYDDHAVNWRSLRNLFRCASRLGKTVAGFTSSPHFLGLFKEAISYLREILLCRGIRR
jgi:hypothetical protein